MGEQRGHLFVIDGDLTKVAVDAWYLPVDEWFSVTDFWAKTLEDLELFDSRMWSWRPGQKRWGEGELARHLVTDGDCDVWIGNVGRSGVDARVDHYIDCALQFAQRAAKYWRDRTERRDRFPIVGINHIGTGNGGVHHNHGGLLRELVNALSKEMNEGRLLADVVLVSHGETAEAAAQRARFVRTENWRDAPQWSFDHNQDHLHGTAEKLARSIRSNKAAIFMGAGVSKGAGLPGWTDLLIEIGQCTTPPTTREDLAQLGDPRDMANLLKLRLSRDSKSLDELLTSRLEGSKYSLQHGLLSSLPCNEFITTNVDELFEMAASTKERTLKVIPSNTESDRWLLKLHGTISKESTLVFTRESFMDLSRNSRALFGLVQAMLFTRHMIFVGYGLGDEDFHEVVYDVRSAFPGRNLSRTIGTVLTLVEDPIKKDLWSDTLEIVAMRPLNTELRVAARDLERFLDLVGMLSSDRSAFLLEEKYEEMLEDDERKLAGVLRPIVQEARQHFDSESAWRDIRQTLRQLGADLTSSD